MSDFNWKPLIERLSCETLLDDRIALDLPPAVVESGWLGFPPATEEETAQLERRLDCRLPESYRTFLKTSNGWRHVGGPFIHELLPTSGVTWFRDSYQDWIDAWMEGAASQGGPNLVSDEEYFVYGPGQDCCKFRKEYWVATLAISTKVDGDIHLLNPRVVTSDGEWEAWVFGNKIPGAFRYRSFWEMVEAKLN